jgi:hypothetical protein
MANFSHLASLFEDISLEDVPTTHVLEIEYPVRGLLPPDTEPLLTPPAELGDREAPPHDQTRAGVFQSTCRIPIPIEERHNGSDSFPEDELIPQFTAFQNMARGPGTSRLSAVTFYDEGFSDEFIRLDLYVSLKRETSPRHYDFELSLKQWQKMVKEDESSWVKALDELITTRSVRAYYHVRNRLAADYDVEAAVAEEAKWGAGWGGTQLRQQERNATTVNDLDKLVEGMDL